MHFIKDYRVLCLPVSADTGAGLHSFFIKEHRDSKSPEDLGRVLFVGNVDYGFNRGLDGIDAYLRTLFGIFGDILSVSVSSFESDSAFEYDTRARFAHISFHKKSSLKAALKADDRVFCERGLVVAKEFGITRALPHQAIVSGVRRKFSWVDVDVQELRAEADEYMQQFEETESAEKREQEHRAKHADADGFVLVQNK